MKRIAAIILLILGGYMIYLSLPNEAHDLMRPPMVSGVAFLLIGLVWLSPNR